eukprot:TRINITY_DN26531_c0_g1_i1.p1 TRINITY_DN26531_c0_g1~~TRINITY_DN26531_c0_g1_i1.p1  ORF type:complete len:682 (+),score=184.89 TRINITY_DN26531_c0_g1_i1:41-2047(+)
MRRLAYAPARCAAAIAARRSGVAGVLLGPCWRVSRRQLRSASDPPPGVVKLASGDEVRLADFPPSRIRNFCITAHVDHGKTTLSTALLRHTGTAETKNDLYLDRLQVEQERGITVKAQTATMMVKKKDTGEYHLLNMIDTPGHVDFTYEVRRSMSACKGAVLLVDARQGIEAQTLANAYLAIETGLHMVYAATKMDMPHAADHLPQTLGQMERTFGTEDKDVIPISARSGQGLDELLQAVIEQFPSAEGNRDGDLRCYLVDAAFTGRVLRLYVLVVDGVLTEKTDLRSLANGSDVSAAEVGILHPDELRTGVLYPGQVGYVVLKEAVTKKDLVMGDTLFKRPRQGQPNPAVTPFMRVPDVKPTIFANFFAEQGQEAAVLDRALMRLCANDSSVTMQRILSPALGQGWKLGFLGMLHLQVFEQRLEDEEATVVFITPPSVPYKAKLRGKDEVFELDPARMPEKSTVEKYFEPMAEVQIVAAAEHAKDLMALAHSYRGEFKSQDNIDDTRLVMTFVYPLQEVIQSLFSQVKSITSGHGTMEYEISGDQEVDLCKLEVAVNQEKNEAFTMMLPRDKAIPHAKAMAAKLKNGIERQTIDVNVQVLLDGKSTCKETVRAMRKDVTAKCYGGDATRKMKKLNEQKKGMKERKARWVGGIKIDQQTFMDVVQMEC